MPDCTAPLLLRPVHQLAGLVITMTSWISHRAGTQLLTRRPQMWVVALILHGLVQLDDGLVTVERFDRHWLLARHRGRAALLSTHGDARSCRMAKRLVAVHGHARLEGCCFWLLWPQTFWLAGKGWPTALRLPSKAKLPSPSARCFGAMAYWCSSCSLALEHWLSGWGISAGSCSQALRPCGPCWICSDQVPSRVSLEYG